MYIFLNILFIILLSYIIYIISYSLIRGAPYAPLGKKYIDTMIELLEVKQGDTAMDIGCGDGRIVIALAQKGAKAHGIEINPLLAFIARMKIKKAGLENNAIIHCGDMWKFNYAPYNKITIYLTAHSVKKMTKKLQKELKKNSRVTSHYFQTTNWKPSSSKNNVYLYIKK